MSFPVRGPAPAERRRLEPWRLLAVAGIATHLAAVGAPERARSAANLPQLSIEELAEIEVSSVSRRPERLADAAASAFVITREDIHRSGATTLPEALRLAPNLQVARVDANIYAITARGMNDQNANKLLVMIDGRSIYSPLHAGVFWDVQDVMLADVERIEVVSGPGGTLWGSNAVNGVINVVTRAASDTVGTLARAYGGNDERGFALRHGGRAGEGAAWRVYARHGRFEGTEREDGSAQRDAWRRQQVGFRADLGPAAATWTLQGDAYRGRAEAAFGERRTSGANLMLSHEREIDARSGVRAKLYLDSTRREEPGVFSEDLDTVDLDVQHHLRLGGDRHDVVWGGNVRVHRDRTTGSVLLGFVPADSRLRQASLFAQDTMSLGQDLKLTLGLKAERNGYTGLEWQPNARLSWRTSPRTMVWGSVSRALRTPARLDRDFRIFLPSPPPYTGRLLGGSDFQSERLTAYELGYRGQPTPALSASATLFVHDYDRLRSIEPDGLGDFTVGNGAKARTHGLEAWASWQAGGDWRLSAGLFLTERRFRFASGSADPGTPGLGANDPKVQALLRSSWAVTPVLDLDVSLRAVGALPRPEVPSWTAVDARLAWQPRPGLELALIGRNLLGNEHAEFGPALTRSVFDRSLALRVTWDL